MSKVWFITGASRGFGKEFAKAALERGDEVVATARNTDAVADLVERYGDRVLPLKLDVTDRGAVDRAVEDALSRFGRLDVVVNNAGYGLFGAVEELDEVQLREQLEVNFFGAFFVSQAVLPTLRAQGSGHIVQISTIGGVVAFPSLGGYHASKWALEGLTESLAQEVAEFGIKVTLIEPGGYRTDWSGSSAAHSDPLPAYDPARAARAEQMSQVDTSVIYGDPAAAASALLDVVDSAEPPLRVLFGGGATDMVANAYSNRLEGWAKWKPVGEAAHGK